MKSLIYYGPHDLRYGDSPKPKIRSGEVLLRIKSVGICGTDLHIYNGGMKNLPLPLIMGHEFSGVIEELARDVKNFKVGDRVIAEHVINCGKCSYCLSGKPNLCANSRIIGVHRPGALAEYLAVPADLVYKIPAKLSFEEGAMIEPLSIAYYAVKQARSILGKKVAVIGQGPIGLLLDQILRDAGAEVIGIDIADWRLKLAKKKKWADHTINSSQKTWLKKIQKIAPEGVDTVFEVVGREETAEMAIEIARRDGDVFILGVFESAASLNMMNIVKKELNVFGSWTCAFSFPPSIALAVAKKVDLKSLITNRYDVKDGALAFKESASYKGKRIKTVINF
ncbi:galactitol-1-phosphate 5-dehydrogenase [Candidatus Falkowbacteria bacterium CG10_big_fil_rev_8_21_14_0_10_37_18]|uniref:Galactitol-1-phosphate 5-dehydrogenase n=1 Tax=Candidatus Falkowbacteria bacterium CG10_big_fil_rev_8_21_14_0_10_37_18 TaxID=1974562 RepID=A0A2H0VBI0_9BACT|nr:MAG: galactitol-1-phosphate 5-dehydrogenase [Candidatus Falkowbacteria bacterium CG10_big_fil_rev_8_21_14_0_10_37_18]